MADIKKIEFKDLKKLLLGEGGEFVVPKTPSLPDNKEVKKVKEKINEEIKNINNKTVLGIDIS